MSDDEDEPSTPSIKKSRTRLFPKEGEVSEEGLFQTENDETAEGVKEVTKGVQDVELEVTKKTSDDDVVPATEEAAAVPLPESPVLQATTSEDATAEVIGEATESEEKSEQSDIVEVTEIDEEMKKPKSKSKKPKSKKPKSKTEAVAKEDTVEEKEATTDVTPTSNPEEVLTTKPISEEEVTPVDELEEDAEGVVDAV